MKFFLNILTFLFIGSMIYSQTYILPQLFNIYDKSAVDSGSVRIVYAMNAVDINDIKTYDDIQRLEIGSTLSKYYSFYVFRNDSLRNDFIRKNPNAEGGPTRLGEFGKNDFWWSLIIWSDFFKDFTSNTLTEYAKMPRAIPSYQYSEDTPVQEWTLHDDTLSLCGYLCQKATCRFRGNDFTAWFAPELPIPNGPWEFGGLPGLILKVYDDDGHYVFEGIQIESYSKKYPIYRNNEKYYQKTDRIKLRKLEKDIYEDYYKVREGKVTNSDGSPAKFTPVPYHPLEWE